MNTCLKGKIFGWVAYWSVCATQVFQTAISRMRGSISPFVEHDQVIAYHLGGKFSVSFFVLPAAGSETPFNINEAAFV
jgi:hypothetical protein